MRGLLKGRPFLLEQIKVGMLECWSVGMFIKVLRVRLNKIFAKHAKSNF